jgi:signal transduction histidine kinase
MDAIQGLVFTARSDGSVQEVILDDLGIMPSIRETLCFNDFLDHGSQSKFSRFLEEIEDKGAALSWEINVRQGSEPLTLHFFGVRRNKQMVILSSPSPGHMFSLYEELIRIVNEQSSRLREAQKANALLQEREQAQSEDARILDEFMQVNNELVNTQRELTRTNERLRRQESICRKIIEENTDALLVVDAKEQIRFANPAAEKMLGLDTTALFGERFSYPLHGMEELEIAQENGTTRIAEIKTTPIDWQSQPAYLVSLRDITSRRQYEWLREEVERITRHDLKSPLNAIIGLPNILLSESELTAKQKEFFEYIKEAGYRMLSMINQSLDLIKLEQGSYDLSSERVDLLALIDRIRLGFGDVMQRKNLSFQVDSVGFPEEEITVSGEELLCHTLLENLIANAVEASPKKATISLTLEQQEREVRIAIHNCGAVPQSVRRTFFNKYITSGKSKGTGLGTYSARLIAEAHGGSIHLSTSEEEGTTVTVRLPR